MDENSRLNELDVSFLQYLPDLVILNADSHPPSLSSHYDQSPSPLETLNKEISTLKIGHDSVDINNANTNTNNNTNNFHPNNKNNHIESNVNNNSHVQNEDASSKDKSNNSNNDNNVHSDNNLHHHTHNHNTNNTNANNPHVGNTVHNFNRYTTHMLPSSYSSPIIIEPPKPILRELILKDQMHRKRKKGKNKLQKSAEMPIDTKKRKDEWYSSIFPFLSNEQSRSPNRVVPPSVLEYVVQVKRNITASLELLEKQIMELGKEVEDEDADAQQRFVGHVEMIYELVMKDFEVEAEKIRQKMRNELVCAAVAVENVSSNQNITQSQDGCNSNFPNEFSSIGTPSPSDFSHNSDNSAPPTPTSLAFIPLPSGTHDILIGEFDLSERETDMLFNLGENDIFFYDT